jgi:hypothetical protein
MQIAAETGKTRVIDAEQRWQTVNTAWRLLFGKTY